MAIIETIEQSRDTQIQIDRTYDEIVQIYIREMSLKFQCTNSTATSQKKFRFTRKPWWDEELTIKFKEMQAAEHAYTKSRRKSTQNHPLRNSFKCKQDVFDKVLKRKKDNTKDPNVFS